MAGGSAWPWSRIALFAAAVPFAICRLGSTGACNAEMAVDALVPGVVELTVCGRAVVRPVAGSALLGGHSARVGFLRAAQLAPSAGGWTAPFACAADDDVEIVDVEDVDEAMEEAEFCRWTTLRGPEASILPTSSEFMPPKPWAKSSACGRKRARKRPSER